MKRSFYIVEKTIGDTKHIRQIRIDEPSMRPYPLVRIFKMHVIILLHFEFEFILIINCVCISLKCMRNRPLNSGKTSLKKIGKGTPKIESENQFLTSIKGRNSVLICQNLPICNPRTLFPNITLIPSLKKIGKGMPTIERNAKDRE